MQNINRGFEGTINRRGRKNFADRMNGPYVSILKWLKNFSCFSSGEKTCMTVA